MNSITLKGPVDWQIGNQIVIGTTGDKFSVGQNEVATIVSVSDDLRVLTLDKKLSFDHLSEMRTVGSNDSQVLINIEAEVGILTRNVVFKGNENKSWQKNKYEACGKFDASKFAVQTCFNGRFGDELGSDQFGAHITIR